MLSSILVALVFAVGLASPTASAAAILGPFAVFFALLLWVVLVGCSRVRRLPGANAVMYTSSTVRFNRTNASALLFRAVNLLQLIAITLAPFDLELQAQAAGASRFARQLLQMRI